MFQSKRWINFPRFTEGKISNRDKQIDFPGSNLHTRPLPLHKKSSVVKIAQQHQFYNPFHVVLHAHGKLGAPKLEGAHSQEFAWLNPICIGKYAETLFFSQLFFSPKVDFYMCGSFVREIKFLPGTLLMLVQR